MTLSPKRAESGIGTIEEKPRLAAKAAKSQTIRSKTALSQPTKVDLVDRDDDVADAEQRADRGVALGLDQHALPGVDHQHGEVGGRGAGRHVAGVLLVAGRVGDDEGAPRRREEAIGDVDGDALLALGLEPVDEQGEIDVLAGRAVAPRILLERRQLVLEDQLGIIEEAADQGRLAVIDRAAGEEAQQALFARLQQLGEGWWTVMSGPPRWPAWRVSRRRRDGRWPRGEEAGGPGQGSGGAGRRRRGRRATGAPRRGGRRDCRRRPA